MQIHQLKVDSMLHSIQNVKKTATCVKLKIKLKSISIYFDVILKSRNDENNSLSCYKLRCEI